MNQAHSQINQETSAGLVFGRPLEDLCGSDDVPAIVRQCIDFITDYGYT